MIKNINNRNSFSCKFLASVFCASLVFITSSSTLANNIAINHSQLEQYISLPDEEVLLKPAGEGVFLSFDFNDNWNVNFDYQEWQDNEHAISPVSLDLTLVSFGGSLSYMQDDWYVSVSIGMSEDDVSYREDQRSADFRQDNTEVTSLSGLLGYSWLQGSWMFDVSAGAQYSDWSIENKEFNSKRAQQDGELPEEIMITEENTLTINAGVSAARYWELNQQQGVLAGAMLLWRYQLSEGENLTDENISPSGLQSRTQPTAFRNSGSNTLRATSGDDNYGQITVYLSYYINNAWSVDVDTSVEIASDNNNQSWAIGISYSF